MNGALSLGRKNVWHLIACVESPNWRASVASETLTGVKMKKSGMFVYWRASEASETRSGVTQSRFRYIYLFIGERA